MATPQETGELLAKVSTRTGTNFAALLAEVLRRAERELLPVLRQAIEGNRGATVQAVQGLALRADIRAALSRAGFDDLMETGSIAAVETMVRALGQRQDVPGVVSFIRPNPRRVAALAQVGSANLLGLGDTIATNLLLAVSLSALTIQDRAQILQDLAVTLDKNFNDVQTLFDTQVSIYGRQMEAMSAEALGPDQVFLFAGPRDGRTRDWCLDRVGKVFTRQDIEQMDNGQLPNPFITGGGYNCRHVWLPAVAPELVELVGTGERAPGFAVNMERIKQLRANARRSDAARRANNRSTTN